MLLSKSAYFFLLADSVEIDGVIELDESDCAALRAFGLPLGVAVRKGRHGQALLDWLEDTELPSGDGVVWLSGEAETVRALKSVLLDRGMQRSQFKIKPYWSVKGHAHRKSIQAEL